MATTAPAGQTQAPSGPSLPPAPPIPPLPVAQAVGAAAKAGGAATVAAVGVTAATLHALSRALAKQRMINRRWLASHAGAQPGAATLRQLEVERQRETTFARVSAGRVSSAMPRALGLDSPEARQAAVKQLLSAERRYAVQQATESMRRLQGAVNFDQVSASSPLGAMWLLGPAKDHTEGCLHMQRRFWPWAVLQRVHPPRHHGCTGYLIGLDEAVGAGLMGPGDIPSLYDAINDAAGVMMEGAAEQLLAELEIREQLIGRGVDPGRLARVPWLGEGYVVESFDAQLHPRDFRGRFREKGGSHAFLRIFDGFEHGGITAHRMNRSEALENGYADLRLRLERDGREVGSATVQLKPPDRQGRQSVYLAAIELRSAEQGNGFGSAFFDRLRSESAGGGAERLTLVAAGVGSYTWARLGFRWDGDPAVAQRDALEHAKHGPHWAEVVAHAPPEVVAEFERKVAAGEFTSEAEMAAWGRRESWIGPEGRMWIGKRVLVGNLWAGELVL